MVLPRKNKLKRDNDFKKVFKEGQYYQKGFIGLKFLKNGLNMNRFACLVGLKISKKAVLRNRIRRRIEQALQKLASQIKPGFDIVVLPRLEIKEKQYQEIEDNLKMLLKQACLFK